MIDGQGVDGEAGFKRGVLVEVVDYNLRYRIPLDLHDHPCVLVGLISNAANVGKAWCLLVNQLRDPGNEMGAVYIVRDLGDDDLLTVTLQLFDADLPANLHASTAL